QQQFNGGHSSPPSVMLTTAGVAVALARSSNQRRKASVGYSTVFPSRTKGTFPCWVQVQRVLSETPSARAASRGRRARQGASALGCSRSLLTLHPRFANGPAGALERQADHVQVVIGNQPEIGRASCRDRV